MRLVLLQLDELRERYEVAVHAVDALHDDEDSAEPAADRAEEVVERVVVVVGEGPPGGSGEHRPLDDAVVREAVVDDEVARFHQVPDDAHVRRVAAHQGERRLHLEEVRELLLELGMDRALTGEGPMADTELPYRATASAIVSATTGWPVHRGSCSSRS